MISKYSINYANTKELSNWDSFVDNSINGTIYHKRKFLSYHRNRFKENERWVIIKKRNEVVAQIGYCLFKEDNRIVAKSPYGASYGGFIFKNQPSYKSVSEIIKLFNTHLVDNKIVSIILTNPIFCCSIQHLDLIPYVLIENGYKSQFRQISSIIDFANGEVDEIVESRARNMERKAINNGIIIKHLASIDDYWIPMLETFTRHGSKPTHTKNQLKELMMKFPREITLDVAYLQNKPVGGICYFSINDYLKCSFYFCQTKEGQENQSLSYLIMSGLRQAQKEGYRYLDFGTTSLKEFFLFKESFSKDTNIRETFEWRYDG